MEELVQNEVNFVEEFPLERLLEEDTSVHLQEADLLVASQVCVLWCMYVCDLPSKCRSPSTLSLLALHIVTPLQ